MKVTCHDLTPYTNFSCPCGFILHFHQTQAETMPEAPIAVTVCKRCHRALALPSRSQVLDLVQATFETEDIRPFPLLAVA